MHNIVTIPHNHNLLVKDYTVLLSNFNRVQYNGVGTGHTVYASMAFGGEVTLLLSNNKHYEGVIEIDMTRPLDKLYIMISAEEICHDEQLLLTDMEGEEVNPMD